MIYICQPQSQESHWRVIFSRVAALLGIVVAIGVGATIMSRGQFPLSRSECTRQMRIQLPDSARVLESSYEQEFGGRLYFLTFEADERDLAGFLRSSPFAATRLKSNDSSAQFMHLEHGGNPRSLETAQVELSRSEFLEIGVRSAPPGRVTVYLILSSGR